MNINKHMKQLLIRNKEDSIFKKINRNIEKLEFVEVDDCILLNHKNFNVTESIILDKTGFEASHNHVHLDDLASALEILALWKIELLKEYPTRNFYLILSSELDGTEPVLRFYQPRINEPDWIKRDDLDSYSEEAIMVIELSSETH